MFKPSEQTYNAILQFALDQGSFDGMFKAVYNHKMPYKHQIDVPMTNISGIFRMSHLKLNGSKQLGFINFHRTEWIMSFKKEFCVEKKSKQIAREEHCSTCQVDLSNMKDRDID